MLVLCSNSNPCIGTNPPPPKFGDTPPHKYTDLQNFEKMCGIKKECYMVFNSGDD